MPRITTSKSKVRAENIARKHRNKGKMASVNRVKDGWAVYVY